MPAGDPALYTEDEQWFDYWGQPNIARDPTAVAFGVASYIATGGSMHNYYMWHGGNHYGNWSQVNQLTLNVARRQALWQLGAGSA